MQTADQVARAIRKDLALVSSPTAGLIRVVRRKWSLELAGYPPAVVVRVVTRLVASRARSQRLVAFELLESHPPAFATLTAARVNALARGLAWGSIDLFGVTVAGPAWRDGRISDATVRAWTTSSDRWRRRLALVATVRLNTPARDPKGDAARTLAICRTLVADRDVMVVKGMSWALRELAKRDPAAVRRFIAAERARLAPRVLREVTNKLDTGLKNP